jgi:hypothetical protein
MAGALRDNLFYFAFLLFDALAEEELIYGPPEVVAWRAGFEIAIAGQVVGEEAQAQFKGDEAGGGKDEAVIVR